jgi:hypothetical protein
MRISRRAFLVTTTAFTTVNLFALGLASEPIDAANLDKNRWYSVWFSPTDGRNIKIGDFSGVEHWQLHENTFLTLSNDTMRRLKTARPGQGMQPEITTHYRDTLPNFNPDTGEGLDPAVAKARGLG